MSTNPNNSDPYGLYQGSGVGQDAYGVSPTPLAGTSYPGYEYQDGGYPTSQPPGVYEPQQSLVARPMQPVYDPVMAQVQQMVALSEQTRSNPLGAWALGLSIVSLLCCTYGVAQLAAIGLGSAGLVAANKGHANNKGLSIAALVISGFSLLLWGTFLGIGYYAREQGY
ncbi:DUF4190 domain-containing protein [Actinomyces trachealis]|uniref:DUF4190 domain-containing protein n=1 Tax=Actinomyces trachealis TaxID=2763540 RepID=UPI0018929F02|nr:DUF4190 domain-containing protein [Actinomyces trachealis]